ncbi:MAG TPA: alpha/beta hydrolase [Rhodospirillaceae bacterium]|nr:alpha/beta hydrolase [Rhodospirillaceae bacterium]
MNQSPLTHTLPDRQLAYQQRIASPENGGKAGVFFMGGYASDMTGSKAVFLDAQCAQAGYGYTRFDYRGHGASSATLEEGCIGDWFDDTLKVFDTLTTGKQVLVGSSMGGWIGLLLARARPERIAGFVGVAAAPDFTEDLVRPSMSAEQVTAMERDGFFYEIPAPPEGQPDDRLPISRRLMEDGANQLVLRQPLKIDAPVRLLQGQQDEDVPWQTALKLAAHIEQPNVRVTLIKDGNHRLSRAADLALLWETVVDIVESC